jgi:hypothetical protein
VSVEPEPPVVSGGGTLSELEEVEVPATSPPGSAVGTDPADSAPPPPQLAATRPRRAARTTASVTMTYFMASPLVGTPPILVVLRNRPLAAG